MTEEVREELQRRVRQFLVHSYIYYELDTNIIPDHMYDWLCKRLAELAEQYPDADVDYFDLAKGVGASGSGFYIKEYPPAIVTTSFRCLWMDRKQKNPNFNEDFQQFIGRWGRKLER
jgi:hypothetical protein